MNKVPPNSVDIGFCQLHCIETEDAAAHVIDMLERPGAHTVVTPNMDHAQRLCSNQQDLQLTAAYAEASLRLCDSRILQKLIQWADKPVPPVVTGSDLTRQLFESGLKPEHRILVLGGSEDQLAKLRQRYPSLHLQHHNPSMGFIRKPAEVKLLCDLVKQQDADFTFLALGSPQQELLAQQIRHSGLSRGVLLCVGASLLFLTGAEQRAPRYLQRARLEWLYRLLRNPRRLTARYVSNALAMGRIYRRIRMA